MWPQIAYFGILLAGGILAPANPTYTTSELTHQLKDSTAKFIITLSALAPVVQPACTAASIDPKRIFVIGKPFEGASSFADLVNNAGDQVKDFGNSPDDVAVIPYSSGTTGVPKGVMLTHRNLVANMLQLVASYDGRITEKDVTLGLLPMFHAYGLIVVTLVGAYIGTTCVVMTQFVFEKLLQAIQEYKITSLALVPPIILAIAKSPLVSKYDLSSVHSVTSGAAPLGSDTSKALLTRLPDAKLWQGTISAHLTKTSISTGGHHGSIGSEKAYFIQSLLMSNLVRVFGDDRLWIDRKRFGCD